MANARTSSSKRKGSKIGKEGGLGGPGGRGSVRKTKRSSTATRYRAEMSEVTGYANRHSKTMSPETRTKLARTKDAIRARHGMEVEGKGTGGPGKKYAKPEAQSRRNPRPKKPSTSARGGSHRAGGR